MLDAVEAELADFGRPKEPTVAMIAAGNFGNGRYQQYDPALLEEHQEDRLNLRHAKKLEKIAAHENHLIESAEKAGEYRRKLVELGHSIMAKKADGVPLTEPELQTLKLVEKTVGIVEDRLIGKIGVGSGNSGSGQAGHSGMTLVAMFAGVQVNGSE